MHFLRHVVTYESWLRGISFAIPRTHRSAIFIRLSVRGRTYRRCTVIILLLTGSTREPVTRGFDLSESGVKRIIRAFNSYGIDGLVAKKRRGRKRIISEDQTGKIIEEFEEPGRAQRTFWTATVFHGHIRGKYQIECSYETVRCRVLVRR
jgi:transposase